jgi:hypothetical protein
VAPVSSAERLPTEQMEQTSPIPELLRTPSMRSSQNSPSTHFTSVHKPCVLRDGLPVKAERIHTSRYELDAARAKGEGTMTEASSASGTSSDIVQRSMEVRAVQESADTLYLGLPSTSAVGEVCDA